MIHKISASAGSGKTYTLTRRFLDLLAKADPSAQARGCVLRRKDSAYSLAEILAATFTNKAAAEMKDRVLQNLKERALADGADTLSARQAEEWVERILRHYGSLNIRTIDSLLAALVRLSALELGLAPDFQPSFSPAEYFTPFYDALMEDIKTEREGSAPDSPRAFLSTDAATLRAAVEQGCSSLLNTLDFKGFTPKKRLHDLVLQLAERLLTGREIPGTDSGAIYARLNVRHAAFTRSAEKLLRLLTEERLSVNARYLSYLAKCGGLQRLRTPPQSTYADKDDLDQCLNKASKGLASATTLAAFEAFGREQKSYPLVLALFRHALQLAPLSVVAGEVHARMRESWKENAVLPAPRLPYLAGLALSGEHGVSDALCRMGTRLSQIMLDEFQDTSLEQWAAILPLAAESLAYGGSLTYVGDVKQAIYGWRGGDARLFDHVPHEPELNAIAGENILEETLPCNWRSSPVIVGHNNAFFSLVARPEIARQCLEAMLPAKTPPKWVDRAAADAVRYFSAVRQAIPESRNWQADPTNAGARVRLYAVEGETVEEVQNLVRRRLRSLLLDELLKTWKPGQIALLALSNSEAALLAEWLTDWGIPVVTENSFLLSSHPLIGRLASFLSFLEYPLDDLAFWEFVSGPECLAPAVLQEAGETGAPPCPLPAQDWPASKQLRYRKGGPPLYQVFRQEFPEAWGRWIAPFFTESGLMSAYDTLKEIIRRYRLAELMPEQLPFLLRFLEIAHLAETRGHTSLAAFLAFWDDCKEDEKLPPAENMNALRILTVHKAKGLEFPVVVLPFQHRGGRREPELAVAELDGLRVLTRAEKGLEEAHYPAIIMNELERLNLLYVAWTRPVYALHAFVTRPKTPTPLSTALEILLQHYRMEVSPDAYEWEDLTARITEEGAVAAPPQVPGQSQMVDQAQMAGQVQIPGQAPVVDQAHVADQMHAGDQGEETTPRPSEPEGGVADTQSGTAYLYKDGWRPMDWLPRLKIYRSSLESAKLTPKRRGILAHLCLEHLKLSSAHDPGEAPGKAARDAIRQDVRRAVRQGMRLFPMPLEAPERAAEEMEACLFWFACLPEAPDWLAHGRREQGIADTSGNMHRVDLLVDIPGAPSTPDVLQESAPPLHAIDYKTGMYPEAAISLEHHEQVRRYMRLLRAARGRPARGSLVYLDARKVESVSLSDPAHTIDTSSLSEPA